MVKSTKIWISSLLKIPKVWQMYTGPTVFGIETYLKDTEHHELGFESQVTHKLLSFLLVLVHVARELSNI